MLRHILTWHCTSHLLSLNLEKFWSINFSTTYSFVNFVKMFGGGCYPQLVITWDPWLDTDNARVCADCINRFEEDIVRDTIFYKSCGCVGRHQFLLLRPRFQALNNFYTLGKQGARGITIGGVKVKLKGNSQRIRWTFWTWNSKRRFQGQLLWQRR